MSPVYFDHNATTILNPKVLDVMLPFMTQQYGNPSSRHRFGRTARNAIEQAREQVAKAVGAQPAQVTFTASGTEANNFAVCGIPARQPATQIAISAIEHPCVTRPALLMQKRGWTLSSIGVDKNGLLHTEQLEHTLQRSTSLVSVMLANNETGVVQNIVDVAETARKHGAMVHTDAVQAFGKIAVNFSDLNVHAMTVSSHKIHGPQGAGALILDKRVDIEPLLNGGGQEKGLRSGTENIAAIVGFGMACELATQQREESAQYTAQLRQQLEQGLHLLGATIFGTHAPRIPNTSFFSFPHIEGETLVMALDKKGFAVASGSACSSDSTEPSHVLLAMGVDPDFARGALRVSLGASNTLAQVQTFHAVLKDTLHQLKQLTSIAA